MLVDGQSVINYCYVGTIDPSSECINPNASLGTVGFFKPHEINGFQIKAGHGELIQGLSLA